MLTIRKTYDPDPEFKTIHIRYLGKIIHRTPEGYAPPKSALVLDITTFDVFLHDETLRLFKEYKVKVLNEYGDVWCSIFDNKISLQFNGTGIEFKDWAEGLVLISTLQRDGYERW